ncbi:amidohydrolase [Burkholderia sp. MSMB617WGS]|uniref:amidohydrolase family protein n=1 Tax=Burkholderia sp. MSMB617WGS TaxID=1637831 RepID=UPI00075F6F95|nr:amidohydrolase family protein [Burkholderia sp. MSMB617WGS]AOK49134.1 amidohydrolase [Burkholderia sp. MSMB617WGS]
MTALKIFDARIHVLPDVVTKLVWKNYERDAWKIRYALLAEQSIVFLKSHGVARAAGICYAAQPGIAPFLNDFVAHLASRHPAFLVPFGTVHPHDRDCVREAVRVLDELGFAGLKIHCRLLKIAPDDDALAPIFEALAERGKVLNLHSGAVAKNNANMDEIRGVCNVERFRRAMRRTPHLKVIVPHIGYDEVQEYVDLLDEFPNLHFDTAMAFGGHRAATGEIVPDVRPLHEARYPHGAHPRLPARWKPALEQLVPQMRDHPNRFLYGSDFPLIPYEWDFEIEQLKRYLPADVLRKVLWDNACALFGGDASASVGMGIGVSAHANAGERASADLLAAGPTTGPTR